MIAKSLSFDYHCMKPLHKLHHWTASLNLRDWSVPDIALQRCGEEVFPSASWQDWTKQCLNSFLGDRKWEHRSQTRVMWCASSDYIKLPSSCFLATVGFSLFIFPRIISAIKWSSEGKTPGPLTLLQAFLKAILIIHSPAVNASVDPTNIYQIWRDLILFV